MKAVILAGGLGVRLRPFTNILPKPLIPISGEKTVLEIQIAHLERHGFREIYIATNYKSGLIESYLGDGGRFGVRLTYSREEQPLGTCGPLSLLRMQLQHAPFLLMNGDILTEMNPARLLQFAAANDAPLTVATTEIVHPFDFGNVVVADNRIIELQEKPDFKYLVVAGIYALKPQIFRHIPDNQYFGIDTLIKKLLAENIPVASFQFSDYWLDIGRQQDLDEAVASYENRPQSSD